jgi:hypothetical protein
MGVSNWRYICDGSTHGSTKGEGGTGTLAVSGLPANSQRRFLGIPKIPDKLPALGVRKFSDFPRGDRILSSSRGHGVSPGFEWKNRRRHPKKQAGNGQQGCAKTSL